MPGLYIDTSSLARVMLGEPDAEAITAALSGFAQHFSSRLLAVELRRVALREGVPQAADALLGAVALLPLDESVAARADGVTPVGVGTLDALHLATALRLAEAGLVEAMLTHDARLGAAATQHGLDVLAP